MTIPMVGFGSSAVQKICQLPLNTDKNHILTSIKVFPFLVLTLKGILIFLQSTSLLNLNIYEIIEEI